MKHKIGSITVAVCLALVLASACSSDDSSGSDTSIECKTALDCASSSKAAGDLCISGTCQPCASTKECSNNSYYGPKSVCELPEGRCSSPAAGTAGSAGATGGGKAAAGSIAGGGRAGSVSSATGGSTAGDTSTSIAPAGGNTSAGASSAGASSNTAGAVATGGTQTSGGTTSNTAGASSAGAPAVGGAVSTGGSTGLGGKAGVAGAVAGAAGALPQCPTGNAYNRATGSCVYCGGIVCPLSNEGETNRVYPFTRSVGLNSGQCICETKDGYFYNETAGEGTTPCDADQDGWVRDSAIAAMQSADPAIRDNARCTVRQASSVVLRNEKGNELELYVTNASDALDVSLTAPAAASAGSLPLYESVRNDSDTQLSNDGSAPALGTRKYKSSELNSLTKACVSASGDYNHNGQPDVAEWARLPGGPETAAATGDRRNEYLRLYTRFGYFVELHRGWYQDGKYYIEERSRSNAADPFGLTAADLAKDDTWRSCTRKRDSNFPTTATTDAVTYDFASVSPTGLLTTGWGGMLHHSQFKCMLIVDAATYGGLTAEQRQGQYYKQAATSLLPEWQVNECTLGATLDSMATDKANPRLPTLSCTSGAPSGLTTGQVRWISTHHQGYTAPTTYVRGCIDECIESPPPQCWDCTPGDYGKSMVTLTPHGGPSPKSVPACSQVCDGKGNCGPCDPGTVRCKETDASIQQVCSPTQTWVDNVSCPNLCNAISLTCNTECVPQTKRCDSSGIPEACGADGRWASDTPCSPGWACINGACAVKIDKEPCAVSTECQSGQCNPFYLDTDGDGYGSTEARSFCGTSPPSQYASKGGDCCDADQDAHPGQTLYFTRQRTGCGGWDFDCSNQNDPQWQFLGFCCAMAQSCGTEPIGCRVGWSGLTVAPDCGVSASWAGACNGGTVSTPGGTVSYCYPVVSETRVQACR